MGLFDFLGLGSGSAEKTVSKHVNKLTHAYVQSEDRMRAAELLAAMGTEEALFGLLKRFDLTVDKSYQDMEEKVYVKDLLVSKGQTAVAPIQRFMKNSENPSWPERILSYILADDEAVISVLLEVLKSPEIQGDTRGLRRARLLSLLLKYQDPRIPASVLPFLHDFDEGVRFTAVEAVDAQEAADPCREELFNVMTGPDEESTRVRRRILEIFVKRQWSVAEWLDTLEGWLPEGFTVVGDKVVEG